MITRLVFVLSGLLAASCGDDEVVLARLDTKVIAVIGSVTALGGEPVADAFVNLQAFRGDCATGILDGAAQAATRSAGQYATTLPSSHLPGARCILAVAKKGPLEGSFTLPDVIFPTRFPTDTAVLDVFVAVSGNGER